MKIENLPPFADFELELKPVICLVGMNGTGKTRLMEYVYHHTSGVAPYDNILSGTHPMDLAKKWGQIIQTRVMNPHVIRDKQHLVVTSHNPYFVDLIRPEYVLVLASSELFSGKTYCAWLTEHPEFERRAFQRAGELWSDVGEQWVLDVRGVRK